MKKGENGFACDSCGTAIPPVEPGGPVVPFVILGDAIGDERWIACSEVCKDDLVAKYYRILHGED